MRGRRRGRRVNGAMRDYGGGVVPRSGSTQSSFADCGIDAAVEPKDRLGRGSMWAQAPIDPFLAQVKPQAREGWGGIPKRGTTTSLGNPYPHTHIERDFGGGSEGRSPSVRHCADGPHLMSDAANE